MDYDVVEISDVPEYSEPVRAHEDLYKMMESLPFGKAAHIVCNSHAEAREKRQGIYLVCTRIRKEGQVFNLSTRLIEEALTPKRQAAYDKADHKGTFKRTVHVYAWKEHKEPIEGE